MNEQEIFIAALQLESSKRGAFLEEACGGDGNLRDRVDKLLKAHDLAGSFLDQPAIANPVKADVDCDFSLNSSRLTHSTGDPTTEYRNSGEEKVGAIVAGKYKLMEEIGEGGMGTVFMAQQTEPVRRAVAVKVIKAGMDSKAVLARFDAERQALAMMDHPNIAKVLDAGTTESGRPFFVMELVKGVPITQFCDDRKLTPRQRLELFVPVCNAIQHAHQKGVIHRDIKPSNVLVALYDDRPVPKVIDFGVAKATGSSMTDKSFMTGHGAVVGTPEYMSPEQASLNNLDIDTRSDVYSLGVLLYELLTGSTPVDRKSLGKAAIFEILRIVREVEAPRPSARLSSTETLPSVAAKRSTEPSKLSRLMKGELDWVLLKALEKDRARRYETANGLARDIQRYLADELVEARPPSAGYRIRKFVRKHKGRVVAVSLVVISLVAGIVGTASQANRAETALAKEAQQRLVAEENERDAKASEERAIKASEAAITAEQRTKLALDGADKLLDFQMENGRRLSRPFTPDEASYFNELTSQLVALSKSETGPDRAEALTRLATVQAHMGLVPEMEQSYNTAIQIHLDLVSNDPANAPKHRFRVAQIREKLARAHQFQIGVSASTLARETLKLADADWQAACRADPKNPAPLIERARLLSSQLGPSSTDITLLRSQVDCLLKLIELKPVEAVYHRQLCSAYTRLVSNSSNQAQNADQFIIDLKFAFKSAAHAVLVCDDDTQILRSVMSGATTYYFNSGSGMYPFASAVRIGSFLPILEVERITTAINGSLSSGPASGITPVELYRRAILSTWANIRKDFSDSRHLRGMELLLKLGEADVVNLSWTPREMNGVPNQFQLNETQLNRQNAIYQEALALARHPDCKLPKQFLSIRLISKNSIDSRPVLITPEEYVWFRRLALEQTQGCICVNELQREFTNNVGRESSIMFRQRLVIAYTEAFLKKLSKTNPDKNMNLWRLADRELQFCLKNFRHDEDYFAFVAYLSSELGLVRNLLAKNREYKSAIEIDTRRIELLNEFPEKSERWKFERTLLADAHFDRGNSSLDLLDWKSALADYRSALQFREVHRGLLLNLELEAIAHFRIGMCLQNLNRLEEADMAFDEAIRLRRTELSKLPRLASGRNPVPWNAVTAEHDRAAQNESSGRWDEAIKRAKKALKTLDENEEVYVVSEVKNYRYELHSIQARCLRALTEYLAGAREWDMAKKFARPDQLKLFYIQSGQTYPLVGRSSEASDLLTEILPDPTLNSGELYDIACCFSLCSTDIKIDKQLIRRHQDRAMEVLQRAVKNGFNNHAHMKQDTDLEPLRNRDDYRKLIAELEKKFPIEKPAPK